MLRHQPVMLQQVLDSLPEQCDFVMDGTLGHGGHTQKIVEKLKSVKVLGVDRDSDVLEKTREFLGEDLERVQIVQGSYAELERIVQESGIEQFDYILLDIGVNMEHFKDGARGFSIKLDGELDMRYDRSTGVSARDRLQQVKYQDFVDVLEKYTDFGEKYRKRLADELLTARKKQPFVTTHELRERAKSLGINDKKLAVLFQAIRIEVNNELGELELFLEKFINYLNPKGGRCAIMTYHSIEDRMVKYAFRELVDQGKGELVNKKVITPDRQEVKKNKAARSAKFRIFARG